MPWKRYPAGSFGAGWKAPAPASAPFVPTFLTGCVAWLRADLGVTTATGVSSWADQSAGGSTLAQGTPSAQPAFSASGGPDSKPCVSFDGVNDFLLGVLPALGPGAEFVLVGRLRTGVGMNQGLCVIAPVSGNDFSGGDSAIVWSAGSVGGLATGADAWWRASNVGTSNLTLATNAWHRYEYRVSTGAQPTTSVWAGGAQLGGGAQGPVGDTLAAGSRMALGCRLIPNAGFYAPCDVAELIVYRRPLTTSERTQLATYLLGRYPSLA